MSTTVKSEKLIKAAPRQIYYALTHATALQEWLCDFATVTPRPGGRMYLWWNGDFYCAGEYLALEENKSITFQWFGRGDPAPSQVNVTLNEKAGGTQVLLFHTIPDGKKWNSLAKEFHQEWSNALENLASVLETGINLRIFNRPMLGIMINDFSAEIAKSMGIPVTEGIRLDDVRAGFGAHAAGLCKDDVLVQMDGKPITNDFGSLTTIIQGKKGGDKVEVVFYRGNQKKTVVMELTKRPIPQIPWDPKELAKQVRVKYDDSLAKLEACLVGASEIEASQKPAPGEWSAKETLSHIIHTERGVLAILDDSVGGFERRADDWGGNIEAHLDATLAAYVTTEGMLAELRRLSIEVTTFLATLPEQFVSRKSSYFLTAWQMLENQSHTLSHIDQINKAISAARKS